MSERQERGLVSVILPVYNRAGLLAETLSSVWHQTYRPIEVVLVDDGSSDGTCEAAQDWRRELPQDVGFSIKCLGQRHAGASAARNRGLLECRGEFIQFLDSDDLLHPDKLARHVARLRVDDRMDFVYSGIAHFDESPDWSAKPYAGLPASDDRMLLRFLQGGMWNTVSGLYPRRTCRAIGPWNEQAPIYQDWDYAVRFILGGPRVDYLEGTLSLARHGMADSVSASRFSEASLRGMYRMWTEWTESINAAGQMDRETEDVLAHRLYTVALNALLEGYVGLAHEVFDTIVCGRPRMKTERSLTILSSIARMPPWCAPSIARAFEQLKSTRRTLKRATAIRRG